MTSATSMGDANKQVWDDTLTRLLDLSTVTVKKNAELESRVTELEIELSAWKLAHANILETAEREKRAHNVQLSTFNRQISTLECFKVFHAWSLSSYTPLTVSSRTKALLFSASSTVTRMYFPDL
jgi:hypothetical protein